MPFVFFIIAISDDEKVFLKDVRGLALLAHHIGVVAAAHKLVEDQKLGLAESADLKHFHLRSGVYDLLQHYVG